MKRLLFVSLLFALIFMDTALSSNDGCPTTGTPTMTQYINSTVTLKILLVEFSDVRHRTSPSAYTKSDFENLLVSSGVYVKPNMYSPDGEYVYGSMRDYYQKMSSGNLIVTGSVINSVQNDIPTWITLSNSKAYYDGGSFYQFISDAQSAAVAQGLNVGGLGDYVKLVIIYAGNIYFGGQLNPAANGIPGTIYIMSERNGAPGSQENSTDVFGRIGAHCHEFGHLLGIGHTTGSRAELMDAGRRNGTNSAGSNGNAPAPLSPIWRVLKGWVTPTVISGQQSWDAYYSLTAPQVFRIVSSNADTFLVENRRFDQNMVIGTTTVPDYNTFMPIAWSQNSTSQFFPEGILVWRITTAGPNEYSDNGLVYASGRYNLSFPDNIGTETDAGDLFPGAAGVKVLSPWSDSRSPYATNGPGDHHNTLYVPDTKDGTNVGMEVISENPTAGYFSLMLYQSSPQDASPSKPQIISVVSYGGSRFQPGKAKISWTRNAEPDMLTGTAAYKIYRKAGAPGATNLIATVSYSESSYVDNDVSVGSGGLTIYYRIKAKDTQDSLSAYSDELSIGSSNWQERIDRQPEIVLAPRVPEQFEFAQNYPNPFNPTTRISYGLPEAGITHLTIFDYLGRKVATLVNEYKDAGYYEANFDASNLSSGIYFYRIQSGNFRAIKKMLLLK